MSLLLALVGLAGLWLGTQLVVKNAESLARHLGVSEFVIGVAILPIGSDLPEIVVAIDAGIKNLQGVESSGVVVGSGFGSTFAQIGLVLATLGLFGRAKLEEGNIVLLGAGLLGSIAVMALGGLDGTVTRLEGAVFVLLFACFMTVSLVRAKKAAQREEPTDSPLAAVVALLLFGMLVLVGSAELTVTHMMELAARWGMPQIVIAVLFIGIGTSLPELSIAIGALAKRKTSLSVGNIIGANIIDALVPIGIAAAISPVKFDRALLVFDVPLLFALSALALFFLVRERGLQRAEAFVLICVFAIYIGSKVATG